MHNAECPDRQNAGYLYYSLANLYGGLTESANIRANIITYDSYYHHIWHFLLDRHSPMLATIAPQSICTILRHGFSLLC
jgi:hypothetical protein